MDSELRNSVNFDLRKWTKSRLISVFATLVALFLTWLRLVPLVTLVILFTPYRLALSLWFSLYQGHLLDFVRDLDNIHENPRNTVNIFLILDGHIPLHRFQQLFQERILQKRPNRSTTDSAPNLNLTFDFDYHYPRLRQLIHSFGGYRFWRWDEKFQVENHIRLYDDRKGNLGENFKPLTRNDLNKFMGHFLSQPFRKGQSPWEVLLHYNYHDREEGRNDNDEIQRRFVHTGLKCTKPQMVVIFRCHHCLGDSHSLTRMCLDDLSLSTSSSSTSIHETISSESLLDQDPPFITQFWDEVQSTFWSFYHMMHPSTGSPLHHDLDLDCERSRSSDRNKEAYRGHCGEYVANLSTFQVSRIREVQAKFRVSYLAVFLSCVCGGIARALKEDHGGSRLNRISVLYFAPKRGKMWKQMFLVLSLREMSSECRLHMTHAQLEENQRSTKRTVSGWLENQWILVPSSVLILVNYLRSQGWMRWLEPVLESEFELGVSNLGMPSEREIWLDGCVLSQLFVGLGRPPKMTGVVVSTSGRCGEQSLVWSVDKAFASFSSSSSSSTSTSSSLSQLSLSIEKLSDFVEEELRALESLHS